MSRNHSWFRATIERFSGRLARRRHEEIMEKFYELGVQMADVDAALADLNDATNEVAGELDDFGTEVAALKDQIAALDPDAAAKLEQLASGVTAAASRLRGLAADPEQPVPPVEDVPAGE
jgi:ABC-type transporter Mla subunit MlaD